MKELITLGELAEDGDTGLAPGAVVAFIFIGGGTNTVLTWTGLEAWDMGRLGAVLGVLGVLGVWGMNVAICLGAGGPGAL